MPDKAFFVDTTKCTGCRSCQSACKEWNSLPGEAVDFFQGPEITGPGKLSAITWNHVVFYPFVRNIPGRDSWNIVHKKCNHCKKAKCIDVCPVKAISTVDGWNIIDQERCIGCGKCAEECPYKVPMVSIISHDDNSGKKVISKDRAYKCNACTVNTRDIPACVGACITGALDFGYRLKIIKEADLHLKRVVKNHPDASIYGIREFGGLRVITLLKDKPEKYMLPAGYQSLD